LHAYKPLFKVLAFTSRETVSLSVASFTAVLNCRKITLRSQKHPQTGSLSRARMPTGPYSGPYTLCMCTVGSQVWPCLYSSSCTSANHCIILACTSRTTMRSAPPSFLEYFLGARPAGVLDNCASSCMLDLGSFCRLCTCGSFGLVRGYHCMTLT
jgi:hypothetical protein